MPKYERVTNKIGIAIIYVQYAQTNCESHCFPLFDLSALIFCQADFLRCLKMGLQTDVGYRKPQLFLLHKWAVSSMISSMGFKILYLHFVL